MGDKWIPTAREYPPDGAEIQWLGSDGNPVDGVMVGRLWFFADRSMYIYYQPQFWRYRESSAARAAG